MDEHKMLTCSPERPWGVHSGVRSDGECPRCGWTAPGPVSDARAEAEEAAAAAPAPSRRLDWAVIGGGPGDETAPALAA